jgi:hypothetical protein
VLPACLRIGRESARCLQIPEPRPPWYPSCPKRKLEGFLPISTKTWQTRGTDWQFESPGFGTELPPPPQRLEAWGCAVGTPACYREGEWAHHGHCPTHCGGAPGSPSAVSPSGFSQLKPFTGADGNVNRLSASYRTSGPIMATVQPTVVELRAPPSVVSPAQTIHGCQRRRGLVLRQLSDLLVPARSITISPGYACSAALQGPG